MLGRFTIYILLIAAGVTGSLTLAGRDMLPDTVVIVSVVIFNALLGFFQEGKTEAALELRTKELRRQEAPGGVKVVGQ